MLGSPWVISFLILPLVTALLYQLILRSLNITILNTDALELLKIIVSIPLAIVGLVIPFLALAANLVFSKMGIGTIKHSLKSHGIKGTIFTALTVLGLELLLAFWLKILPSSFNSTSILFVVLLSFAWSLGLIVSAGLKTATVVRAFDPENALLLLKQRLRTEAMHTLREEILRNVVFNSLESELPKIIHPSYFQPERGSLIASNHTGVVKNISVVGCHWIAKMIDDILKWNDIKIELVRTGQHISVDDLQIASMSQSVSPVVKGAIARLMNATVTVRKLQPRRDPLYSTLEEYKEAVLSILRSENEYMTMSALEGFAGVLKDYMQLGIRLSAEDSPNFMGDWRPIMFIFEQLDDFVESAAQQKRSSFIGLIAHWAKTMMQECVREGDVYLFERFLRFYQMMYWHSLRHQDSVGLHRAHFEPLHIFDYDLFRFGKTEPVTLALVESRIQFGDRIVVHLERLLKNAIEAGNVEQTKEIMRLSSPGQILAYFHPEIPFDRWEVKHQLDRGNPTQQERQMLAEQLEIFQKLDGFSSKHSEEYQGVIHNAVSYLLEKNIHGVVTSEQIRPVFMELWNNLGEWVGTQRWVEGHDVGRGRERLWEHWEDSRTVQSRHPLWYPLLVMVLRGLYLQKQTVANVAVLATRITDSYAQEISNFCSTIPRDTRFSWLLGSENEAEGNKLREAFEQAKKQYQDEIAESIRSAQIDSGKVAEYGSRAEKSFQESATVFEYLKSHGLVNLSGTKGSSTHYRGVWESEPKEAFIEQDRVSYSGWGDNEGRTVGHSVDDLIAKSIFDSLPPEKHISGVSLEEGLTRSLDILKAANVQPTIILIPYGVGLRMEMNDIEGFVPSWQLKNNEHGKAFGTYHEIPILSHHGISAPFVLIGSSESIQIQVVTPLTVEVREFSEKENEDTLKREKGVTIDKLKERVSSKVFIELNIQLKSPEAFVAITPTKQD